MNKIRIIDLLNMIAEAMYKTAQENINVLKLQTRVLETQLKLEFGEKS